LFVRTGPFFLFSSSVYDVRNKVYADKIGKETMITAIAMIIVAILAIARYTTDHREVIEKGEPERGSREASERQINGNKKCVPVAVAS